MKYYITQWLSYDPVLGDSVTLQKAIAQYDNGDDVVVGTKSDAVALLIALGLNEEEATSLVTRAVDGARITPSFSF